MTVRVRPAASGDGPGALALDHRLEEGVSPWRDGSEVAQAVPSWVRSSIDAQGDGARACFVAEEKGQVIGFISVEETRHWSGTSEAHVGELMVAKAAEGRGTGRALVDEAAAWGLSRGCSRISLETGSANSSALAFYESLAFEHDEVRLSREL